MIRYVGELKIGSILKWHKRMLAPTGGGCLRQQGVSRFTWEGLQTWVGYNYGQIRNIAGKTDRVDYLGGATFAIREDAGYRDGISIGNYININLSDRIIGNFEQRVMSDPLFMHEYGHTFDSRLYGPLYLFSVGIPSGKSATNSTQISGEPFGVETHDFYCTELRANRHAAKYFKNYYNVDWSTSYRGGSYETYYPRKIR